METHILQPSRNTIHTTGKIAYSESVQSWNTIRLKKDIINEFSALKEKSSKFAYSVIFHRGYNDLEKALRKMKREKTPLPMLFFIEKI